MNPQEVPASKSEALYERAKRVLPGGVSRNTILRKPHPAYVESAAGCRITDIEGVTRIDFANNMASLIHGHAHPAIVEAVADQVGKGTAFTLATEAEVAFAEHICSRNDTFELIRFVNSGTEAVMGCLKAARAFTGKAKIAKAEGAYHGAYDYAEVSQTSTPDTWGDHDSPSSVPVAHGTPAKALEDVVVLPFNDPATSLAILDRHAADLACVLLDPMPHRVGLVPATTEFVEALRDWTARHGVLLVFDEVISLRSSYGGAQEWYDISPDLTAMGKIIGGGFPVGALAGRREVMSVMDPLADSVRFPHSGTFSANPVTMRAGLTAMELFDHDAARHVNRLGARARAGVEEVIGAVGIPACVTGGGSMLRVHLKATAPHDYRSAFSTAQESQALTVLLDHLFDEGFIMINTCSAAMSTAMGDSEIDALVAALADGLNLVKERL